MRVRNKPWAGPYIARSGLAVNLPAQPPAPAPLHVELGCGKGGFAVNMAERHPEVSFIAVEMDSSVLAGAVKAAEAAGSPANLRFALGFAEKTDEYFGRGEVTRIYINFCDPWRNRARWFKRRLTHRGFLDKYRRVLKPGGDVWVKTDNRDLFKFSLREFAEAGWVIKDVSEDLANSGFEENVVTEYERRFMENGLPIYRIAAYAGDGCPV